MPQVTGTSIKGYQTLTDNRGLSNQNFLIYVPGASTAQFEDVGYGYAIAFTQSTPAQIGVVAQGIIYRPGRWLNWVVLPNVSTLRFRVDVEWKQAGIPWVLFWS